MSAEIVELMCTAITAGIKAAAVGVAMTLGMAGLAGQAAAAELAGKVPGV